MGSCRPHMQNESHAIMTSPASGPAANRRRRAVFALIAVIVLAAALWAFLPGAPGDARPVLKVGSQRGGAKSMMTAAGVLDDLPYRIEWSEFPAAQSLLEAIGAGAVDVGGVVDAWATWSSYVASALLHGDARILADSRGLMTGQAFQAASESAIAAKRPQLRNFTERLDKAHRWAMQHPELYARALAEETGLPLDVATYVTTRQKLTTVPIDRNVIEEERNVLEHFIRAGALRTDRRLENAFDASFNP